MRTRGDHICLHEPFGRAYYRGIDRRTTRLDENPLEPGRSYKSTWNEILATRGRGRVFSKDFPNYIMHMVDGEFLDHFQHTFLIRDPAKTLASLYNHWNEFTVEEAGYADLHRMFDLVVDRYGVIPPLIDADDLVDEPAGVVGAYCAAVGIDFIPEALEWEPGEREEVRWYGGDWHESLSTSTGLTRQEPTYRAAIEETPFLRDMYARCRPHYEALATHKLLPR